MKKVVLFGAIIMTGMAVSAADMTKEEFMAKQKAYAEKSGKTFDEKKSEAAFAQKDINKDGVISAEERVKKQ